jgi:hypothetical protein
MVRSSFFSVRGVNRWKIRGIRLSRLSHDSPPNQSEATDFPGHAYKNDTRPMSVYIMLRKEDKGTVDQHRAPIPPPFLHV